MSQNFLRSHPFFQIIYYIVLLIMTLSMNHPACVCIAWLGICFSLFTVLEKKKENWKIFALPLFFALPSLLINILFRPFGMVHLFDLPWGAKVTLEMLLDGVMIGFRLGISMLILRYFYETIESDRILFLLSRFPQLSIVLSLIFRYLPRFTGEAKQLRDVQKLRFQHEKLSKSQRLLQEGKNLAGLSSWAIESSIRSADAMEARGLGLPIKRSRYQLYHWHLSDTVLLVITGISTIVLLILQMRKYLQMHFYPILSLPTWGIWDSIGLLFVFVLFFLAFLYDLGGGLRWHYSKSRI